MGSRNLGIIRFRPFAPKHISYREYAADRVRRAGVLKAIYPNEGAGHFKPLGQIHCRAGAAATTDLVHLLDQLVAHGLAPDILRHRFGLRCNKKVRVSSALVLIETHWS
jgi:hypothetical protein